MHAMISGQKPSKSEPRHDESAGIITLKKGLRFIETSPSKDRFDSHPAERTLLIKRL
jgi:hypothetical protein